MFGHLKQKKGGAFFLDALRRAGVDGRLHLLIVGDAEPEMIAHLQSIESAVSWTHVPFVDRFELLPYYAACDAVVIPSLYDGMPNVLLEAGALGVPPVASTAGGMADLLTGGENALTFPPGDVHECRRALVEVAGLPLEALRRMGETASGHDSPRLPPRPRSLAVRDAPRRNRRPRRAPGRRRPPSRRAEP